MRLADLDPKWLRWEDRFDGDPRIKPEGGEFGDPRHYVGISTVGTFAEAQGIGFLCPACYVKNGGAVGTHLVWAGFHGRGLKDHQASQSKSGGPSRWNVASGSTFDDLTLTPSIDCACWHGFITNGEAT